MISEHLKEFAGKKIVPWEPGEPIVSPNLYAQRIALDWDEMDGDAKWIDKFAEFIQSPGADQVTALVIGPWEDVMSSGESTSIAEALVAARDRLVSLKAIFFGDILSEESEISWIQQGDLSALLNAYPNLEYFGVRGGNGLSLGIPHLPKLRSLVVESGGLPVNVVREVAQADLPALEHLELWLGDENYGADTTVDDLMPLFELGRFPRLTNLGLRDSEIADGIAVAVAEAPIIEQLHTLDLSLGTLGDEGARALLASEKIRRLKKLDLHHHYCSDAVMAQLKTLPLEVDLSEREDEDKYGRYVAVSE